MDHIIALIEHYKYFILFPLAAYEGPVISLVVGFLVFLGYLNFIPAYIILLFGDIIPDTIYYYIGRYGNKDGRLLNKYGAKWPTLKKHFHLVESLWRDHPFKSMFLGKLAYSLSIPFLISAGMVKMPYKKFITCAIPVTIFQYAVIMGIGYYLGNSYAAAEKYITYAGIGVAVVAVIFAFFYMKKYVQKQITELEIEEEKELEIKEAVKAESENK
ncbi:MAG: VTT domain-containing protein [Candidatus Taylorbacteria bacterium]|nr:VTT domain-containing protein [Candidatus Taylorbacteria bacterium]